MTEPTEPARPEPTSVSVAVQIEPFLMNNGYPFAGDVQVLAEQMTQYLSDRISERFTAEHLDAGMFLAVAVKRGEEIGSFQYREGHYVKDDDEDKEDGDAAAAVDVHGQASTETSGT